MDDYILRINAIEAVIGARLPDKTDEGIPIANGKRSVTDCVRRIKEIPAADVQPVVHGKWVEDADGCMVCSECSNCAEVNCISGEFMESPYCNVCGAKMDGGDMK